MAKTIAVWDAELGEMVRKPADFFGPIVPEPEPVPASISDRQFFQALAMQGLISQDEALAAVKTGEVPADMQAFVDQLPAAERFAATMLLSGATSFNRDHPLVDGFGAAKGMTPEQIDDLWRFAATL